MRESTTRYEGRSVYSFTHIGEAAALRDVLARHTGGLQRGLTGISVFGSLQCTFAPWQYAQLPDNPVIASKADPLGLFLYFLEDAQCPGYLELRF